MQYYLTTNFSDRTWFHTLDNAIENARCIWLTGEVPCVWVCDAEDNMVWRIKNGLDLQ